MSARTSPSNGPWSIDGFDHVVAGQPDYGSMILAADGETIVAQCVAEHNLNLISAAPQLYDAAEGSLAAFKLLVAGLSHDRNVADMIKPHIMELEIALAKASPPVPKADAA